MNDDLVRGRKSECWRYHDVGNPSRVGDRFIRTARHQSQRPVHEIAVNCTRTSHHESTCTVRTSFASSHTGQGSTRLAWRKMGSEPTWAVVRASHPHRETTLPTHAAVTTLPQVPGHHLTADDTNCGPTSPPRCEPSFVGCSYNTAESETRHWRTDPCHERSRWMSWISWVPHHCHRHKWHNRHSPTYR